MRLTIESNDGLEIVCETGDGEETLASARKFKPQIILLDIDIPKIDGFQVMDALRQEKIESKVIFLTVHREESFMRKALSLGGTAYVLKDCAVTDILAAIRAVAEDLPFISPAMTTYLIKTQSSAPKDSLESLTPLNVVFSVSSRITKRRKKSPKHFASALAQLNLTVRPSLKNSGCAVAIP